MFDAERYFEQIGIEQASSGHKHSRPNWVQVECPFCTGNPGYHLGFNLNGGYFNCWRCGWHSEDKVVSYFSNVNFAAAKQIIELYQTNYFKITKADIKWGKVQEAVLPSTLPLQKRDLIYLKKRGFEPRKIEAIWGVKGSNVFGTYKFRIVMPIYLGGKLVSYQTRDITGKSELRYLACPMEKEALHHKHILYGLDKCLPNQPIIVTEGIMDVWKLGPGAVCTFGTSITHEQLNLLAKNNKVYILFDPEKQAQQNAKQICAELRMRGVECENLFLPLDKDPGDCTRQELKDFLPFWKFRD